MTLAAAFLFAVSCNELSIVEEQDAEFAISMSPGVDVTTKAAIDGTTFPTTRSMKVSAYYNAPSGRGTSANYFSNTRFVYNSTDQVWAAEDTKYWPFNCTAGSDPQGTLDFFAYSVSDNGTGACDIAGYSPTYLTNVAQGATVVVPDNFTNQYDMIFGRSTGCMRTTSGTAKQKAVPMTMRHAMALIVFTASCNVERNTTTNTGITINSIVLEDAFFGGTVAMNCTAAAGSQCTWSSLTGQHGPSASASANKAGFSLSMSNYDVPTTIMNIASSGNHMGIGGVGILVPEQSVTKFYITYTLHNGKNDAGTAVDNTLTYLYEIPSTVDSGKWLEGKKYNYRIAFTLTGITITPTVTDWTPQAVDVPIS